MLKTPIGIVTLTNDGRDKSRTRSRLCCNRDLAPCLQSRDSECPARVHGEFVISQKLIGRALLGGKSGIIRIRLPCRSLPKNSNNIIQK